MEEITINADLVIRGNLICGDDGIIEAKGPVVECAGNKDAFHNIISKLGDRPRIIATSDYDISGKIVKVSGPVVVRNGIIYNEAYSGHISANTSFQPINRYDHDKQNTLYGKRVDGQHAFNRTLDRRRQDQRPRIPVRPEVHGPYQERLPKAIATAWR